MYMKRRGEDESSAMSTSARHASRQARSHAAPLSILIGLLLGTLIFAWMMK